MGYLKRVIYGLYGSTETAIKVGSDGTVETTVTPNTLTHANITFSDSSAQTIVAAPGAGYKIRIVILDLTALNNVEVALKSASTTIRTFQFSAMSWAPPTPINLAENEALVLDATDATRITGGVSYYLESV